LQVWATDSKDDFEENKTMGLKDVKWLSLVSSNLLSQKSLYVYLLTNRVSYKLSIGLFETLNKFIIKIFIISVLRFREIIHVGIVDN